MLFVNKVIVQTNIKLQSYHKNKKNVYYVDILKTRELPQGIVNVS